MIAAIDCQVAGTDRPLIQPTCGEGVSGGENLKRKTLFVNFSFSFGSSISANLYQDTDQMVHGEKKISTDAAASAY